MYNVHEVAVKACLFLVNSLRNRPEIMHGTAIKFM